MAGLLPTNGLKVTANRYWYLTASTPYQKGISSHALMLVRELYYGYYLVLYCQTGNKLVIIAKDGNNKLLPTISNDVLTIASAGGNFEINVSILDFPI